MNEIAVSFPNMNIDFNISRVAFTIFGLPIYWYGIIISLAFLVCVVWAMKDAPKYNLVGETVIDLVLVAAPISIICARIFYVIFSWDTYKNDLTQIFNFRNGGLAIYGGIIGAVISAYIIARVKKLPMMQFSDFAIPYVALGQAIGRWGNFFNQEAFGTNTSLPWGMTSPEIKSYLTLNMDKLAQNNIIVYPDLPVHPTFLYESIWDLAVFAFLLSMRKRKKFDGEVFCLYFVTYGIGRAFIESLRTDSLMIGNLRVSVLLSVVAVLCFGAFIIIKRIKKQSNTTAVETGHSRYAEVLKVIREDENMAKKDLHQDLIENNSAQEKPVTKTDDKSEETDKKNDT